MMDKNTAIKSLKRVTKVEIPPQRVVILTEEHAKEIADFIEQQDRDLSQLLEQRQEEIKMRILAARIKNGEIVIAPDAIIFKDTAEDIDRRMKECHEWEQYAELGRLSLTTRAMVCSNNDFIKRGAKQCEKHCTNYNFCQKRAELLTGGNISE